MNKILETVFVDSIESKEDFHRIMPRVATMLNKKLGINYSDFYKIVSDMHVEDTEARHQKFLRR